MATRVGQSRNSYLPMHCMWFAWFECGGALTLDLEFSLMVNPDAGRNFDIPNSLPSSIEVLNILGRSDETDQHSQFISSLVNAKRTGLLDLKKLSHRVFISGEYRKEPNVAYTDLCQQCGWHDVIEKREWLIQPQVRASGRSRSTFLTYKKRSSLVAL